MTTLVIFKGPEGWGIRYRNTVYGHQIYGSYTDALWAALTRFGQAVAVELEAV